MQFRFVCIWDGHWGRVEAHFATTQFSTHDLLQSTNLFEVCMSVLGKAHSKSKALNCGIAHLRVLSGRGADEPESVVIT